MTLDLKETYTHNKDTVSAICHDDDNLVSIKA